MNVDREHTYNEEELLAFKKEQLLSVAKAFPLYPQNEVGPTFDTDYRHFDSELREVSQEFKELEASDPNAIFLGITLALPGNGKDYVENTIMDPAAHILLGASEVTRHKFDEKAQKLREKGVIKTPRRQPLLASELYNSRQELLHDGLEDIKAGSRFNLWNAPAGAGIQYGVMSPMWYKSREYSDNLPFEFVELVGREKPDLLKHLYLYVNNITRGPWMDVWSWYRQFMIWSENLDEADRINALFGKDSFCSEDEWHSFQVGGSIAQVEVAQFAHWSTIQYYKFGERMELAEKYTKPIADSLTVVQHLLGVENGFYNKFRVTNNLIGSNVNKLNFLSIGQFLKDDVPTRMRHTNILNNPPVNLTSPEQIVTLRNKIQIGQVAFGIDYNHGYTPHPVNATRPTELVF
jgi:hypothetical protein